MQTLIEGIEFLEHDFELFKKILDGHLCEVVDTDKMQYGYMPGRGTVDAVIVLRRLTEKFRAKNKKLFFIFVDMEKTFDWVPREVINFALRRNPSKYTRIFGGCSYVSLQRLKNCCLVDGGLSSSFSVKVGVHQRFALITLWQYMFEQKM